MCTNLNRRASEDANFPFFQSHVSRPTDLARRVAKEAFKAGVDPLQAVSDFAKRHDAIVPAQKFVVA